MCAFICQINYFFLYFVQRFIREQTDLDVTISCSEGYNGDMDRTIKKSVSGDSTYSIDIVGLSGEEGDIQQAPALSQHQAVLVAL